MDGIEINLSTSDGFEPSERLRAALDRVIAEYEDGRASDDDVVGFGLQIGTLDVSQRKGTSWNDGCWFYSKGDDGGVFCGWFQALEGTFDCKWYQK